MLFLLAACTASVPADSDTAKHGGDTSDSGSSETASDHYFPDGSIWYEDVTGADPDPTSDLLISTLQASGWGLGRFQIDTSITVLTADASTPKQDFLPTGDFYSPDCDQVPVPLPDGGHLEGETGYTCQNDGDCHLLVVDREESTLYEMWRANVVGDTFHGGCLATWDMGYAYPPSGRGDQCTSADAAGYPITPLLFTADEVAAGEIDHAIRFILPNESIRDGVFYHPATHATNSDGGGDDTIPYGAHLRLKPDFDLDRIDDPDARVVAVALQTYGMFLADGGNVALTAASDDTTTAKWADLMDTHSLEAIEPQDFEVLELGDPIDLTFDCVRN